MLGKWLVATFQKGFIINSKTRKLTSQTAIPSGELEVNTTAIF